MPDGGVVSGFLIGHALYGGGLIAALGGASAVASLAATAALSGVSYAMNRAAAKKMARGLNAEAEKIVVKEALPQARVIYGRALVGGSLCFAEHIGNWLYYGLMIADHEIDAVEEIRMGDRRMTFDASRAATSVPYYDGTTVYAYCSVRLGGDDQAIDPILDADFEALPSTYRQRGVACVVLKLYYPPSLSNEMKVTLYGNSGQPAPLFLVRGKKVFDPRDPSQSASDPSTWKWSRSASLCAADFQTMPRRRGGGGSDWSEIDLAALRRAADDDDTPVPLKDGGTEPRYACDGIVPLDGTAPSEVVQKILTANMGSRVTSNGQFKFFSGVWRDPVWTLTDNSARGSMNAVLQVPLSERVNIVSTSFISLDRAYQAVQGPELRNTDYITEDGAEMPIPLELPYTTSHTTAQRLAKLVMEESRVARTVSRRENLHAILLDAADVVNLECGVLSACNGIYMIEHIGVADTPLEFDVVMKGTARESYLWTPDTDEQPFTVSPPDLS
jgi:hypothetical protein